MKDNHKGFVYLTYSIFSLLNREEYKTGLILFFSMLLSSIVNAIGVTLIVPFITVASNPHIILDSQKLSFIYHYFNFTNPYHFIFSLGLFALAMLLIGNTLNTLVEWLSAKISYGLSYRLSNDFLASYLTQPYLFFLNKPIAELKKNLLKEINQLSWIILTLFSILSKALSALFIITILMIVNPIPACIIVISLSVIYGIVFLNIRHLLKKTSYYNNEASEHTFKITEEVFSMIKEVKLYHKEKIFLNAFELPTRLYKKYAALHRGLTPIPRYLLEIFAFGGIILLVLYLLISKNNLNFFLPTLGFFVLALYRIIPIIHLLFSELTLLLTEIYCVQNITQEYKKYNIHLIHNTLSKKITEKKLVESFQVLHINHITFQYPNTCQPAIQQLSLDLSCGKVIGLVGPSGAGKTTLIDIILGFLKPQQGQMIVNGIPLDDEEKIRDWQTLLGYVPQMIMLSHNSILNNIAFGELPEEINFEKVKQAAQFAELHHFIEALPEQYETIVGDRGIRLSGGQRQRIGIARALYRNPQLLILDEATNALDGLTEMDIMHNIHDLAKNKTIIIIAHRLQTVMACDCLYYIDQGRIVAQGTYDELAQLHEGFKNMIAASEKNGIVAVS